MQVIHNFKISISEYAIKGQDNDFPVVSHCPECYDIMIKHGFYSRSPVDQNGKQYNLFIRRYKCKHPNCGLTVSVLPSFLIPHFQRTLKWLYDCIKEYYLNKKYILSKRQTHFYCTRFRNNTPGIISFFREKIKFTLKFDKYIKKKAIKLIEMIKNSPVPTFSKRYYNHFQQSFMAN